MTNLIMDNYEIDADMSKIQLHQSQDSAYQSLLWAQKYYHTFEDAQ